MRFLSEDINLKIKTFLESKIYVLIISLLILLSYAFGGYYTGFGIALFSILLNIIFKTNFSSLPITYFACLASTKTKYISPLDFNFKSIPLYLLIALMVITLVVFLIDFIKNIKYCYKDIFKNPINIVILIMVIPMLFSIMNSVNISNTIFGIILHLENLLIGIFIIMKSKIDDKFKENFGFCLMMIIYILLFEVFDVFLDYCVFNPDGNITIKEYLNNVTKVEKAFLWAHPNHGLYLGLVSLFGSYYLFVKNKGILKFLAFITLPILAGLSLFLDSRGTLLAIVIVFIFFVIDYIKKHKENVKTDKFYIGVIAVGIIACIAACFILPTIREKILKFYELGLNGRKETYQAAFSTWLDKEFHNNTIFGCGINAQKYYLLKYGRPEYHYHNYFLETLACLGVFGVVCLAISFVIMAITFFKKKNFSILIVGLFAFILVNGLIDTIIYNEIIMPYVFMILYSFYKERNDKKEYIITLNEV